MNYPRVTITITEREAKESDFPPEVYKNLKLVWGTLNNKAYNIHYNNPEEDFPLDQDRELKKIILESMRYVFATVNRFADTSTNKKLDSMFRYRNNWVKLALQDTTLTKQQREAIESIQIVPIKKKGKTGEFMTQLAKDVKPLVLHLKNVHKISIKESRGLILEFLNGWFPKVPAIQKLENNDAFEKAIQKTLPKNGNK